MREQEYIEAIINNLQNSGENALAEYYQRQLERFDKILKQSDRQQLHLVELNQELENYKQHLERRVEEEVAKQQEKEKLLMHQSRLASMGEMIDAIAHQWGQPLTTLKLQAQMLSYDIEDGLVNDEYLLEYQNKSLQQLDHMVETLQEFRSFFRPAGEKESFSLRETVNSVLLLVHDEIVRCNIDIEIKCEKDLSIVGTKNEFKHLLLNLINNAKDAFEEHAIKNRKILIVIEELEGLKRLSVLDNAGGIPEAIIETIFQPNVTTKEEGKGTGIGLYMSSQIAQKYQATLKVENYENGARFIFEQATDVILQK